ncbi:hypothetical protein O6H91_23G034000 [Diphasiastrum complanatum]|uniref:Uncharacterized protein n=1 Tax=Diphasiastrum complanatum TaxID=34168 RepID=A0ACC2A9Q8_DIPCM|nr:hypothetical protein O6H91_23G034000 [Diphasiastrum complanatum]
MALLRVVEKIGNAIHTIHPSSYSSPSASHLFQPFAPQCSKTSPLSHIPSSCLLVCSSSLASQSSNCLFHQTHLPCSHTGRFKTSCRARKSPKEASQEATSKEAEATKEAGQSGLPVAEEEEVEISWIQEKAEDLVQYTGEAIGRVPGPRVGSTSLPWLVALPLGYMSITFLLAIYKTIRKINSPREKRRRQVGRNAFVVRSLDEFFPAKRLEFNDKKLHELEGKCGFDTKEVLRKYIRYALNERPFNPDLVADLIHLRKVAKLDDEDVAEVLNEVARRIVKEKGTVVMDLRGFTEKGVKRKAAVQSLFSKLLYLSELEEFCASSFRSSLTIKEVFGVTDEDANSIRIDTLSELSDVDSLEKMVTPESDDENFEGN